MSELENLHEDIFELFVSDCNNEDLEIRIEAIKKLPIVAKVLGVEETINELIPYLDTFIEGIYNDDEVLVVLTEQFGSFLPYVGGIENVHLILNLLEKLAMVEENMVRARAVKHLHNIALLLNNENVENLFVAMLVRLADTDCFVCKSSATELFGVCYSKISPNTKADLRNIYRVLCQDDSPLVRRSAAAKLPDLIEALELNYLKDEFIPVFDNIANDDQDSVRVLAIDIGITIAYRLKSKETKDYILSTFAKLFVDASWKVRFQLAQKITAIEKVLGYELTKQYLILHYQNLVSDVEPQVREAAAKNIVAFCVELQTGFKENNQETIDEVDPIILNQIFPLIQSLDQDSNTEVKEALSAVITSLSPLLGIENTKTFLLPLIISSVTSDSSKAKEIIISNLNNIISVIGINEIIDNVLDIMIDLVNNSASMWRTRRNLIVTINFIAKKLGKEYFDEHLKPLYQKLLSDGVYAIRKTAPLILPILVKNFGIKWAKQSLVPEFLVFSDHQHYLYRYICLFCIDELVTPTLEAKSKSASTENDIHEENRLRYLKQVYDTVKEDDVDLQNKAITSLNKINKFNSVLKLKLEQQWVLDILQNLEDNFVPDDDIRKYAEDTIEMFTNDNNIEITCISKEEIDLHDNYLEGILDLIIHKWLNVLEKLSNDPVSNIKINVGKTVKKIVEFNNSLENELNANWVKEFVTNLEENIVVHETPMLENKVNVDNEIENNEIISENELRQAEVENSSDTLECEVPDSLIEHLSVQNELNDKS